MRGSATPCAAALFVSDVSASQISAIPPIPGPTMIAGRIIHGLRPARAAAVNTHAPTSEPPSQANQRRSSFAATCASRLVFIYLLLLGFNFGSEQRPRHVPIRGVPRRSRPRLWMRISRCSALFFAQVQVKQQLSSRGERNLESGRERADVALRSGRAMVGGVQRRRRG